jgi:hypothetical protein
MDVVLNAIKIKRKKNQPSLIKGSIDEEKPIKNDQFALRFGHFFILDSVM